MGAKVTADPVNKIIQVDLAPVLSGGEMVVDLDVQADLYSDLKEDWIADLNLSKYLFPMTAVGGNPLPGSKALGSTFFLDPTWKIRPYEGNHTFRVSGNLFSDDGTSPFTGTVGAYQVLLTQSVSSLVSTVITSTATVSAQDIANAVWSVPDAQKLLEDVLGDAEIRGDDLHVTIRKRSDGTISHEFDISADKRRRTPV